MRETLRAADSRWLVVSYSDEGIISLEALCDLLASEGSLSLRSIGYVKYPGGKQSMTRTIRNQELALVVDRQGARGRSVSDLRLADVRLARLMTGSFHPSRIRERFAIAGEGIVPAGILGAASLSMNRFWRFSPNTPLPRFESDAVAESFAAALAGCAVTDVREEIDVLVELARADGPGAARDRLLKELLRLLNRLAHRKYRAVFERTLASLRAAQLAPRGTAFQVGLDAVERRARARCGEAARTRD